LLRTHYLSLDRTCAGVWTKRIPVKITFDQRPDVQLGPGMSVKPRVTVR
jgi:multidrug resistance efflux pump